MLLWVMGVVFENICTVSGKSPVLFQDFMDRYVKIDTFDILVRDSEISFIYLSGLRASPQTYSERVDLIYCMWSVCI